MPPRPAALLLPVLLLALPASTARAQVKHCVAADGRSVYTDRRCEALGASDYLAPPAAARGPARPGPRSCPRSVQDLAYALGEAVRASDVNRLAALYDWTGMSTDSGYRVMEQLQAIVQRPLVAVQPLYAETMPESDPAADNGSGDSRLLGLRVEQTLANGSTPSRSVFGLRRNLGCWWLRR